MEVDGRLPSTPSSVIVRRRFSPRGPASPLAPLPGHVGDLVASLLCEKRDAEERERERGQRDARFLLSSLVSNCVGKKSSHFFHFLFLRIPRLLPSLASRDAQQTMRSCSSQQARTVRFYCSSSSAVVELKNRQRCRLAAAPLLSKIRPRLPSNLANSPRPLLLLLLDLLQPPPCPKPRRPPRASTPRKRASRSRNSSSKRQRRQRATSGPTPLLGGGLAAGRRARALDPPRRLGSGPRGHRRPVRKSESGERTILLLVLPPSGTPRRSSTSWPTRSSKKSWRSTGVVGLLASEEDEEVVVVEGRRGGGGWTAPSSLRRRVRPAGRLLQHRSVHPHGNDLRGLPKEKEQRRQRRGRKRKRRRKQPQRSPAPGQGARCRGILSLFLGNHARPDSFGRLRNGGHARLHLRPEFQPIRLHAPPDPRPSKRTVLFSQRRSFRRLEQRFAKVHHDGPIRSGKIQKTVRGKVRVFSGGRPAPYFALWRVGGQPEVPPASRLRGGAALGGHRRRGGKSD